MMDCPRCHSSSGIVRIPSRHEPVSSVFPFVFGTALFLVLPAFPSRFRCDECHLVFRKCTPLAWLYLAILGLLVLLALVDLLH